MQGAILRVHDWVPHRTFHCPFLDSSVGVRLKILSVVNSDDMQPVFVIFRYSLSACGNRCPVIVDSDRVCGHALEVLISPGPENRFGFVIHGESKIHRLAGASLFHLYGDSFLNLFFGKGESDPQSPNVNMGIFSLLLRSNRVCRCSLLGVSTRKDLHFKVLLMPACDIDCWGLCCA